MIQKAIIPAAGLGSRMLPLSKRIPKEMLRVCGKPMIEHAVEEAVDAGLNQICIVIRRGKENIRDYLVSQRWEARDRRCELAFVYQESPRGLGDALLQARDFAANESFVLMMPDQLMRARLSPTLQLLSRAQPTTILSGLVRLAKDDVAFFAGARGVKIQSDHGAGEFVIERLQREEETAAAFRDQSYELRGFGRTVYPPQIFDYLSADFTNPVTGEVDLWKTFEECAGRIPHRGMVLEGQAFDFGTLSSYHYYLPRFLESSH